MSSVHDTTTPEPPEGDDSSAAAQEPLWAEGAHGEHTLSWPSLGVTLSGAEIVEDGRSIQARLTIQRHDKLLHWSEIDLTSAPARRQLVEQLGRAHPKALPGDWPWLRVLELFCFGVADRFRNGGQGEVLTGTEWEGEQHFVWPLAPMNEPSVIYADGESCKGFLALLCAFAACNPGERLPGGIYAETGGPVLYLDWESNKKRLDHRVKRMSQALKLSTRGQLRYLHMGGRSLEHAMPHIRSLIARHGIKLVIVDSLMPACVGAGSDPTSAAIRTMTLLNALGVSSLVIGHITKVESKKPGSASIFGSAFFRNLARATWSIRMVKTGECREVTATHRKVNDGPMEPPLKVTFEFEESGLVAVHGAPGQAEVPIPAAIQAVCRGTFENGRDAIELRELVTGVKGSLPNAQTKDINRQLRTAVRQHYLDQEAADGPIRQGADWAKWQPLKRAGRGMTALDDEGEGEKSNS